jgi:signal transduction histidine kinase
MAMLNGYSLDPSSVLIAFFELPRWVQVALPMMAALLVVMNSIVGTALWSRRKALLKVEELRVDLADVKARLRSETRWRLADERHDVVSQVAPGAANDHPTAVPAV